MDTQINETIPRILITPDRNATHNDRQQRVNDVMPQAARLGSAESSEEAGRTQTRQPGKTGFWGSDGFGFDDLLDFINPLQHIPVVSTIYRAVTGDEIGTGPRIFGGAVLGGVVGAGMALANAAVEYETGKDLGGVALAALDGVGEKAKALAGMGQETLQTAAATLPAATPEAVAQAAKAGADKPLSDAITLAANEAIDVEQHNVLGGVSAIHQQYRQAQMVDLLQDTAMDMQA
ncbi:MAG: hypothetical protein ACPG80_00275 [Rickettsiales bacterium]